MRHLITIQQPHGEYTIELPTLAARDAVVDRLSQMVSMTERFPPFELIERWCAAWTHPAEREMCGIRYCQHNLDTMEFICRECEPYSTCWHCGSHTVRHLCK